MNANVAKFAPAAIGVSTLLSWFTVPFLGSMAGYNTDTGLLLIALSVTATICAVKGKHLFAAAGAGAAGAWMVAYVVYLSTQSEDFFGTSIGPLDFAGFGFWAAVLVPWIVTGIAVVAHRRAPAASWVDESEPTLSAQ